MRFDAIIFDFDGVIVDSETVSNAALAEVLSTRFGLPMTGDEAVARYSGLRWADCHRMIERDLGRSIAPGSVQKLVDEAMTARVGEVPAIEGIADFLAAQAHRRLAIASSSDREWLDSFLARLGLAAWFGDHVYSAAGLARGKPHPDVYLMAADRLGVRPERCIVIEDHPLGAAAGAAAGAVVIGLLAASHIGSGHAERLREAGAQHIAADYVEAAAILARLEGGPG